MSLTRILPLTLFATTLAACGGGSGGTGGITPTAADAFTENQTIRAAASSAQSRWSSVSIASISDPRSNPVPQSLAAQPQAMAAGAPMLNVIKLQETETTIEEYFATKQSVADLCTNDPTACDKNTVTSISTVTANAGLTPQETITSGDFTTATYVINGRTYTSGDIDITEADGDTTSVGYICEITQDNLGEFTCLDGTITAISSGLPLSNLPTSGTARYAAILIGSVQIGNTFDEMAGRVDIVVNLTANFTSSGTISGVTNNISSDINITFAGDIVVDNNSGLMGSDTLTVSYGELQQNGLLLGWLNADGGTLTSGYVGSTSSDPTGFTFDGAFAGVKVTEANLTP